MSNTQRQAIAAGDDRRHLPLWRVLEEEFEALHGPLPAEYKAARKRVLDEIWQKLTAKDIDPANRIDPADRDQQESKEILKHLYRCAHNLPEKRTALCLSGGGIRSATFGLGVLQGLARRG